MEGVAASSSADGGEGEDGPWIRLVDVPQDIPQGWSTYASAAAGDGVLYRRLRLKTVVNHARCRLADMRVVGAVRHTAAGDSPSCGADVVVTARGANGGDAAVLAVPVPVAAAAAAGAGAAGTNFTYARSATPSVTSVAGPYTRPLIR